MAGLAAAHDLVGPQVTSLFPDRSPENLQQSRTKPTDKPALERFFKSLRLSLLDKRSGYKGPNIASRGNDVEKGAFYYVTELEDLISEWVGDVYHLRAHRGLRYPLLPKVDLSPQEMFNRGIEFSGLLRLPAAEDLRYELMEVQWRKIHHYGVDIDGRRYDGPGLNTTEPGDRTTGVTLALDAETLTRAGDVTWELDGGHRVATCG